MLTLKQMNQAEARVGAKRALRTGKLATHSYPAWVTIVLTMGYRVERQGVIHWYAWDNGTLRGEFHGCGEGQYGWVAPVDRDAPDNRTRLGLPDVPVMPDPWTQD